MSRYIRTKDGAYELCDGLGQTPKEVQIALMTKEYKQADTIEELCDVYIDEESIIDFNELSKYDYFDLDKLIEMKSTEKYHLIGVFWYNK